MFNVSFNKNSNTKVLFIDKNTILNSTLQDLIDRELLILESGSHYVDLDTKNEGVIYLGYNNNNDLEDLRTLGFNIANILTSRKVEFITLDFNNVVSNDDVLAFVEGLMHSTYHFDFYKEKKTKAHLEEISLTNTLISKESINELKNLMSANFKARNFVNLRANDLYPESYVNMIKDLFKDTNVQVSIYDEDKIKELNMDAFLAVSKGSDKKPYFVVLKYLNDKSTDTHTTFVGKGVTYDSGGYAIKPATSMSSMNSDMAGSAAVIGALKAINDNNLKVNVVGVMALTENLISGSAFKNGDIINSMKGLSIEIGNTDAEGRLTLADSIYFSATKLKSSAIIELSTLTGACIVALGSKITGVVTNDDDLYGKVHEVGNKVGEFNWRLPITKQLKNLVKGTVGDLKNSIPGGAGAITAGIFLTHFSEDVPFVHLDIAGPSYSTLR